MTRIPISSLPAGLILMGLLWLSGGIPLTCDGQTVGQPLRQLPPDESVIVAVVDGFAIHSDYVMKHLQTTGPAFAGEAGESVDPQLWAGAVEHLIRRQVVLKGLQDDPASVGPSELKMELERIGEQLESAGTTLEQHVKSTGFTRPEFENELRWRMTWSRYLDRVLSEKAVEEYFAQHRADFDGTKLLVDQILWIVNHESGEDEQRLLRQQAAAVFGQLQNGELEWEAAVGQYSMSPLAGDPDQAGRLIGRNAPMPERFSEAAFALKKGEISPPVETGIGLHIIRCLEIRPGDRTLDEVSQSVRTGMTSKLFDYLATRFRPNASVEYRPGFPRLDAAGAVIE